MSSDCNDCNGRERYGQRHEFYPACQNCACATNCTKMTLSRQLKSPLIRRVVVAEQGPTISVIGVNNVLMAEESDVATGMLRWLLVKT